VSDEDKKEMVDRFFHEFYLGSSGEQVRFSQKRKYAEKSHFLK
jgi:hypothetical protein